MKMLTATAVPQRNSFLRRVMYARFVPTATVLISLGLLWTLLVSRSESRLLPRIGEVAAFMVDELRMETIARRTIYENFATSVSRLAIGLAITMLLGSIFGVAMGRSQRLSAILDDYVIALLNMPYLIWGLLIPLWFGFAFWTPIITVVLGSISFVIVNVAEGVRNVPRELLSMASAYGVDQRRVIREVTLPSLAPFLFAGFRYALSLGWKALVLAEVFGATSGVGWMIKYWYDSLRITALVGYALFFVLFSILVDRVIVAQVAKRVFRWQGSGDSSASALGI